MQLRVCRPKLLIQVLKAMWLHVRRRPNGIPLPGIAKHVVAGSKPLLKIPLPATIYFLLRLGIGPWQLLDGGARCGQHRQTGAFAAGPQECQLSLLAL